MKNIKKVILLLLFFNLLFSQSVFAQSYGWGYKKSPSNEAPDIGKYADIIADHQAFYMDESEDKVLYLTFDNGYEMGYTEKILNILKQENVPATFFLTGHYVDEEPELVKRMVDDGHIIGNHSNNHPDFTKITKKQMKEELDTLEEKVRQVTTQEEFHYFRPPRGTFNEKTLQYLDELGYTHIFWSVAFKDWMKDEEKGWRYAYDQLMQQIHPGAIVLLHTVSPDNANALEKVIQDLKNQGYTFKSLDDLMIKQSLPDIIFTNE